MRHLPRSRGVAAALAAAVAMILAVGTVLPIPASAGAELVVDPTVVEVVVTPSGWSSEGASVTISVTVTTDEGAGRVPATGDVQFVDVAPGTTATLGTAPLQDGRAQLVTTTLARGRHEVGARYTGLPPARPQMRTVVHDVVPDVACPRSAMAGHPSVVRLVYMELLGRCPDPAGLAYWVDRLGAGTSSEAFARAIAATPEAVGRVVDDGYRTMLGRAADRAGRAHWVDRLRAHGRYDQLLADLGASAEFWARGGGTDRGFVVRVYDRLLGRVPDGRGLDYWLDRYATGTSRRILIRALANQSEPLERLVALSYYEILDRAPSADERAAGVAHLLRTGDRSGLYAQLIGRPEFADRASTLPG